MTVKVKTWKITAALVVLTAILSWLVIYLNSERKSALNLVGVQQGVITEYSIKIDTLKEKVYETELIVVDRKKELNLSKEQLKRLAAQHIKDIKVIAELELQISALRDSLILNRGVDTVSVEEVIMGEDTVSVVRVPFDFGWKDSWASSWGAVSVDGLGTSGFEVTSLPLDIVLGSRGVFNKSYVSAASSPNPYVCVSQNNVQLVQKKSRGVMVVTTSAVIGGIVGFVLGAL
jgi:hypothetical protein